MASANVELVRSIFADWERGDYRSADWADPDIEYVFADGPSPGSWEGFAEMAEAWREWLSAWDGFRAEADDYRVLDDERVLVLNSFGGRGKTSGVGVGTSNDKGSERLSHPEWEGDQACPLLGPRTSARRPRPRPGGRLARFSFDR